MTWTEVRPIAIALALGLLLGAGLVWRLRPATPARVEYRLRELTSDERASLQRTVTVVGPERVVAGPVSIVERWRTLPPTPSPAPGCPPCPGCAEHERTETRQPVETDRGAQTTTTDRESESRTSVARAIDSLQIAAAPPGWAVSAGLQLLPDQRLEVGVDRRLFGPFWARAWVLAPASLTWPAVGVGLRVEW